MFPIRLRILLLAIVSLLAVGGGFYVQYQEIQTHLQSANSTKERLQEIATYSKVIHALQKERGLSGGQLLKNEQSLQQTIRKQRISTDSELQRLHTLLPSPLNATWQHFAEQLQSTRHQIDQQSIDWPTARDFYSQTIRQILSQISLSAANLHASHLDTLEMQAMVYLAIIRENLGLMRAQMGRIYQRGGALPAETVELAHHLGSFQDHYHLFTLLVAEIPEGIDWINTLECEVFYSVLRQVKEQLHGKPGQVAAETWWQEATLIIDSMQQIEHKMLDHFAKRSEELIETKQKYLFHYQVTAISLFLLVAGLTIFTVLRILNALSILLQTLEQVRNNQDFAVRIHAHAKDEFGLISFSINSLLTYIEKIIEEKDFLATTDLLTGVKNRRSLSLLLEREMLRSERYGSPLSLIYCDIDHFKSINDGYGHGVGDQVLKGFALLLKENIRGTDYLGRWGGEEFVIAVPNTEAPLAVELAEKLRLKVLTLRIDPVEQITCSFGVAQKLPKESLHELCERADQALYKAKTLGRNQVHLHNRFPDPSGSRQNLA